MAIKIDSTNTGTSGATLFNVVVASTAQKIVFVSSTRAAIDADRQIFTVVRSGQSFTPVAVADNSGDTRAEVWYLDAPTVGTANINITYVGGGGPGFASNGAYVLSGAAGGGAENTAITSAATGANPSLTVTTTSGALVIDVAMFEGTDGSHRHHEAPDIQLQS